MRIARLCILGLCLATGLFVVHGAYQDHTHRETLPGLLTPYVVPTITYNDIEYTITDTGATPVTDRHTEQKLLQLAYFVTANRIDPLLALPGTDIQKLRAAIDELEASRDRVASVYNTEDRNIIRASLYPIPFLKSLLNLERQRRQIIKNPSFSDAEVYQQQFIETYDLYIENIETLQYAIETLVPDTVKRGTIRFHTGSSNVKFITDTLADYQDGITRVYETQRNRFRCYKGMSRYCTNITNPQTPSNDTPTTSDEYDNIITQHQNFIKAFRQSPYRGHGHPTYESVEMSTSRCGEKNKPGYYYLWWREDDSGLDVFRPDLLHNLYFYDFWNGIQSRWRYAQTYRALGGSQYIYQSIAGHYVCPDLGLDMAVALSMLYVAENKLHISPIGTDRRPDIDPLIDAINSAYSELSDSPRLRQAAVEKYIDALHTLLSVAPESDLYEYIGSTTTQTAYDLVVAYHTRTAYVSDMLMSVVNSNEAVADYALHGTSTGLDELLLLRTVPMVLYGGFTPTIQPRPLTFIRHPISEPPEVVVTLSDLEIEDMEEFIHMLQDAEQVNIYMSASVGTIYPVNSSD